MQHAASVRVVDDARQALEDDGGAARRERPLAEALSEIRSRQQFHREVVLGKQSARRADGGIRELAVVGPVEVRFENRYTHCNALVLPADSQILLGAIPIEDMDVLIHPREQRLMVNPDHPLMASKPVRLIQNLHGATAR